MCLVEGVGRGGDGEINLWVWGSGEVRGERGMGR